MKSRKPQFPYLDWSPLDRMMYLLINHQVKLKYSDVVRLTGLSSRDIFLFTNEKKGVPVDTFVRSAIEHIYGFEKDCEPEWTAELLDTLRLGMGGMIRLYRSRLGVNTHFYGNFL